MAIVKLVKFSGSLSGSLPGSGNCSFYGYATVDGKRMGNVTKFNDGGYSYGQDFDKRIHSRENRPFRASAKTLKELKEKLSAYYCG